MHDKCHLLEKVLFILTILAILIPSWWFIFYKWPRIKGHRDYDNGTGKRKHTFFAYLPVKGNLDTKSIWLKQVTMFQEFDHHYDNYGWTDIAIRTEK